MFYTLWPVYKVMGKAIVVCILDFTFLERIREEERFRSDCC